MTKDHLKYRHTCKNKRAAEPEASEVIIHASLSSDDEQAMDVYQAQGQGGIPDQQVNVADDLQLAQHKRVTRKATTRKHKHCPICPGNPLFKNPSGHAIMHKLLKI